jgi:hypothetical protein
MSNRARKVYRLFILGLLSLPTYAWIRDLIEAVCSRFC